MEEKYYDGTFKDYTNKSKETSQQTYEINIYASDISDKVHAAATLETMLGSRVGQQRSQFLSQHQKDIILIKLKNIIINTLLLKHMLRKAGMLNKSKKTKAKC